MISSIILMWVIAQAAGQVVSRDAPLPKFEDYPVKETFKGHPAQPILTTPHQQMYRTRIRDAAAKGPNFAGHYTIVEWGCGSPCAGTATVDEKSGKVFDLPYEQIFYPFSTGFVEPMPEGLNYRIDSRLLIFQGCPVEPKQEDCASYYLEWTGSEFKLLRKLPAIQRK